MKNVRHTILFSILAFLVSCSHLAVDKQTGVINDVFLTVTDTIAYYELSLRPPAPRDYFEKNKHVKFDKLLYNHFSIILPDTLFPLNNWASSLRIYCKSSSFNDSKSLIDLKEQICKELEEDKTYQRFKVKDLKNTGRYLLISEESKSNVNLPIVGKLQFSQVIFNKKNSLAAFVAVISDGGNLFIEKLFTLAKENEKWKVINIKIISVS